MKTFKIAFPWPVLAWLPPRPLAVLLTRPAAMLACACLQMDVAGAQERRERKQADAETRELLENHLEALVGAVEERLMKSLEATKQLCEERVATRVRACEKKEAKLRDALSESLMSNVRQVT